MKKHTEIIFNLFVLKMIGDDLADRTCQDNWNMKRSYRLAMLDKQFRLVKDLLLSK